MKYGVFILTVAFLAGACSGSGITQGEAGSVCASTADCGPGLICEAGACGPATEPGFVTSPQPDASATPSEDAAERISPVIDAGKDEGGLDDAAEAPGDGTETDGGPSPGLGEFGDPCEEDLDCYSGLCAEHMGDTVCTKTCESECPAGWSCEQVTLGGGDPIYLCVSLFERLCQPCLEASDCESLTSIAACISYGEEGAFCGATCESDADCPEDFVCQESVSTRGGGSMQCLHVDGVCPCSQQAVDLGLQTMCEITNEVGTCSAPRLCTDEGLSACEASVPAAETCNGVDDDCDGELDEGSPCDDANPCTEDQCLGEGGCQNVILEGAACDDADAMTSQDTCNALGECVGVAITCPEGPCVLDAVPNGEGCDVSYKAQGALCDDGDASTKGDQCDGASQCVGTPYACEATQCQASATENGSDCDIEYWAQGHPCDDGDPATQSDVCDGTGGCAGSAYTCTPGPCDASSEPDGEGCVVTPKVAGIACDDGDSTTNADQCDGSGGCAGTPYTCEPGVCVESSTPDGQGCALVYSQAGVACDDGDINTQGDQCDGSGGCAGSPYTCTATQCEASSVATGEGCEVEYWASGHPCDDGDVNTQSDQCDGQGGCVGSAYTCEPTQCQSSSVADGVGCLVTNKLEGIACDDGVLTTKGDACDGQGGCAGTPYTCAPGLCEVAASPNGVGCDVTYALEGAACDDGQSDTLGDQCDGQGGCAGTPYTCTPGLCEVASTPDGQGCVPSFAALGVSCDDGNPGTKDDLCDGQGGCAGTPFGCVAQQCELSSVPDGEGCSVVYENQGAICDDGEVGTQGDQCDGQGGCAGTPYVCEPTQCELSATPDGVGCVVENAPASVSCDDGDDATKGDVCDGFGACVGELYACLPTQCELSSTPNGVGCDVVNTPVGGACDDGDPTTVADQCDGAGACSGTPSVCGDGVTEGVEVCDDGNNVTEQSCPYGTPSCTACRAGCIEVLNLTGPYCGDNTTDGSFGEECDDGNSQSGDGCSEACQSEQSGCVTLGVDVRTLDQEPWNYQQNSCQTLCEVDGGIIPSGFRLATSAEAQHLTDVLSFGSCAGCGAGSCWWYSNGGNGDNLNMTGVTGYSCATAGCFVKAPFCYTQVLLVREGKDGTCSQ